MAASRNRPFVGVLATSAVALILISCGGEKEFSVLQVQESFAAEGITLARGPEAEGAFVLLLAEEKPARGVVAVVVFADSEDAERQAETFDFVSRRSPEARMIRLANVVVAAHTADSARRAERALLERLGSRS